jgi:CBS domain-containing protein
MRFETPVLITSLIKKAITVTPKTSVVDARDLLLRYRIKRLVVVNGSARPVGIITEKDLARATSVFSGKDIWDMKVDDFMSENLITVKKNSSVYDVAKLMKKNKISSVVVLNENNSLAGIITKTDLSFAFLIYATKPIQVSEYMTRKVITVDPAESLFVVESVLVNNRISRIIVEKNNKPIGIITYRDFIPHKTSHWVEDFTDPDEIHELRNYPRPTEFNANRLDYALTFRAEDIMTPNPITINKGQSIFTAALLMTRHQISGLPVINNGFLTGIITKSDIVSAIAEG